MIYLNGTSKHGDIIYLHVLRLVFLDKEYSSEVFQTLLAVPHFSKVAAKKLKAEPVVQMCSWKLHKIHRKTHVPEYLFTALSLQLY